MLQKDQVYIYFYRKNTGKQYSKTSCNWIFPIKWVTFVILCSQEVLVLWFLLILPEYYLKICHNCFILCPKFSDSCLLQIFKHIIILQNLHHCLSFSLDNHFTKLNENSTTDLEFFISLWIILTPQLEFLLLGLISIQIFWR
jgi:hypothetical protein